MKTLAYTAAVLMATAFRVAPRHTLFLLAWILWSGAEPLLRALTGAALVDAVASIRNGGLSGWPALPWPLAALVGLILLDHALSPWAQALAHGLRWRLDRHVGSRLMVAVSRPEGIAHLEDSRLADRIALARGEVLGTRPGSAAYALALGLGPRLAALGAGLELLALRWWAPLVVLAAVAVTAWAFAREMEAFQLGYGRGARHLRRALYFRDLAAGPAAAKEVRTFDLGGWAVERLVAHWRDGLAGRGGNELVDWRGR